jgi:hypothetical protein
MTTRASQEAVYVHLGLSRAASTFLQTEVFPKFRGIVCFPKRDYRHRMEVLSRARGKRVLFSHEGISRRRERLEALQRDLPDCHPILVLRRQDRWLASRYKYQLHKRGYLPFESFLERFEREVETGDREPAYFAPYLERLEKSFGKRPLVVLHEELIAEPWGAIRILADGVGARIDEDDFQLRSLNASLKDEELQILRRMDTRVGYRRRSRGPGLRRRLENALRDARVGVASLVAATRRASGQQEKLAIAPPEQLEALRERYAEDWAACLSYVWQDRELLIDPEAP